MAFSWTTITAALAVAIGLAQPADAGRLQKLSNVSSFDDIQLVDPTFPCSHRFTGNFEAGDARKITSARPLLLCLDSPGGSLVEALKVTAFMKQTPIATRLEANARCESACALVFMGGVFWAHESEGPAPWRVMHPTARLGFHAPSLSIPSGRYDEANVKQAYGVALQSVAKIVFDLIHRNPTAGSAIPFSLLGEMLTTPPDQMLYVETVDQAGRWGIDVGPVAQPRGPLLESHYSGVCANAFSWIDDESAKPLYGRRDQLTVASATGTVDDFTVKLLVNEMAETGCEMRVIQDRGEALIGITINYRGPVGFDNIMLYDPSTLLSRLPVKR